MNAQELMAKARFEWHGYFVADQVGHLFASPSMAAMAVMGRSANGWIVKSG